MNEQACAVASLLSLAIIDKENKQGHDHAKAETVVTSDVQTKLPSYCLNQGLSSTCYTAWVKTDNYGRLLTSNSVLNLT